MSGHTQRERERETVFCAGVGADPCDHVGDGLSGHAPQSNGNASKL